MWLNKNVATINVLLKILDIMSFRFKIGEITLCPPVVCPKNIFPICGLKTGTLPT